MENILDKDALQTILRRNWSSFVHKNPLVAFVLQQVRDAELPESLEPEAMKAGRGLKLTLSRVELLKEGLFLWIDFSIPIADQKAHVGTCEAILSLDGNIRPTNTVGQTLRLN